MASWLRNKIQQAERRFDSFTKAPVKTPQAVAETSTPTPQNPTLFQAFEWHTPGHHWNRLGNTIQTLSDVGVTSLWLPPGCKANEPHGNGYDCYDIWDLGEFDQKWSRSTKWGSREELDSLIAKAKSLGIKIIWDAVLNHKTAGDATEECWVVEVDPKDRSIEITKPKKIEPWIHYNFPGRGNHYSSMKWHWQHFSATDWDQRGKKNAIFKIVDPPETHPRPGAPINHNWRKKGWAQDVEINENIGNFDYLMFTDIDYSNPEVREDIMRWGDWMVSDVGVDGFRLDAVPHFSYNFTKQWVAHASMAAQRQQRELFVVGEFLVDKVTKITEWMDRVGPSVKAYDVPLVYNFSRLSLAKSKIDIDLRKVLRNTLVSSRPDSAVTFVMSHDTQPGQTVATAVASYFKPLAYAIILLRQEGLPCVWYGDVYGTQGPHAEPPACQGKLPKLMLGRKLFAYGQQTDYFESRTSIGWVRHGTWDRQDGCAVVMSIGTASEINMFVGTKKAGQTWTDMLGNSNQSVTIDERGYGIFPCAGKSVSVFVRKEAAGREKLAVSSDPQRFTMQS